MSNWEQKSSRSAEKLLPKNSKRRRSSSSAKEPPQKSQKCITPKALILDNGAYSIKAGYSKDEVPKIIPNCIMKAKSERKRLFIGSQINECRDCSGLYFLLPCERGYITRWEVQKPVWDHVFSKNVCPIDENPVILTQPLFNFNSIQDCIDEIFFEEYEVPSLFRCNPTDIAYLHYTREHRLSKNQSCLIIDSGFSFTHVIPYIKGNKYLRGIKRLNVGGKLLTNHLKDIISYRQYNVMEETYVINQVKEDTCYVAEDVKKELAEAAKPSDSNSIVRNYVLPDFNNIRRGYIQEPSEESQKELEENCQILRLNNERFVVPEILFHPSDIGMKSMGIAEAAVKSIFSCPKEQRESLARNIVVIGGNCKFPGFKQRMYAELRSLLPDLWEVKVFQPEDPISYAWQGGNTLLKGNDLKINLATRQDYDELGSTIIQQRFNTFMVDNSNEIDVESSKKCEETFKYLEKLKSRSIFGKQESANSDSTKSDEAGSSSLKPDSGEVSGSSLALEKEESNKDSEDTSQDSVVSSEVEKIVRKMTGKNLRTKNVVGGISQHVTNDSEEDLTCNSELFPFGTGSYL